MIPSRIICYTLMDQYHMPEHIKAHSLMVEKIAVLIGQGLIRAGISVSLEKVMAGALLHDIAKSLCFNSTADHAAKGAEICRAYHFDEISMCVEKHINLGGHDLSGAIKEEEIVYYADKRVNHDIIVSLEERMNYLFERYAKKNPELERLIQANFKLCRDVEDKLFAHLPFIPEEVALQLGMEEIV
ncbi:MAG: HDIG domain-containing protein [Desulfobacteraceae bacterium]|nr:MAG: HDIG domain-containing protein [Desulfobacteraceae bacterium]